MLMFRPRHTPLPLMLPPLLISLFIFRYAIMPHSAILMLRAAAAIYYVIFAAFRLMMPLLFTQATPLPLLILRCSIFATLPHTLMLSCRELRYVDAFATCWLIAFCR